MIFLEMQSIMLFGMLLELGIIYVDFGLVLEKNQGLQMTIIIRASMMATLM
jgi:hypothetical protein